MTSGSARGLQAAPRGRGSHQEDSRVGEDCEQPGDKDTDKEREHAGWGRGGGGSF